jgi:CRP/FNR family transcriptional regulator, cyclic AMP receptor protein
VHVSTEGLIVRDLELLKENAFFSGLSDDDLKKIEDISIERKYRKNMIIFMEGDPGEAFYYIKSGKVKIFRTYDDGREHIVHIMSEGDVFGEATLFSDISYPASASIYEDSIIGVIKNKDLEKLIKETPDLSLKLIKLFAHKLIQAQQKIKELTFNDVFSRTASQILKLAEDHGKKNEKGTLIDIQVPRQELADMVGTTRETVSRAISRFKKEKSIAEQDDRIIILNEEKLKTWQ